MVGAPRTAATGSKCAVNSGDYRVNQPSSNAAKGVLGARLTRQKKSCPKVSQTMDTGFGYVKIKFNRWAMPPAIIGLFSVPAPPFRLARAAGFFCSTPNPDHVSAVVACRRRHRATQNAEIVGRGRPGESVCGAARRPDRRRSDRRRATARRRDCSGDGGSHRAFPARRRSGGHLCRSTAARSATVTTRAIASLELLVSVQTNLLDGRPRLVAHSIVAADSVRRLDDLERGTFVEIASDDENANIASGGCLFRLSPELSYAQLVHPADSHSTVCQRQPGAQARYELRHELFTQHLEKGVILRARVLGVLLPRANDLDVAAQCFADFLAAELPLTT
jgi:hypothetical protein